VARSITGESPGISPTIGPPPLSSGPPRAIVTPGSKRLVNALFQGVPLRPSSSRSARPRSAARFRRPLVSVSVGRGGGNMQLPDGHDPVARQEPDGKASVNVGPFMAAPFSRLLRLISPIKS